MFCLQLEHIFMDASFALTFFFSLIRGNTLLNTKFNTNLLKLRTMQKMLQNGEQTPQHNNNLLTLQYPWSDN